MNTRRALFRLLPPIITDCARGLRQSFFGGAPQWEYRPTGWNVSTKGWNVEGIARLEKNKWNHFAQLTQTTAPLGVNHEDLLPTNENSVDHNTIMSFAYVLALTAGEHTRISVLDWGGGLGHYYVFARTLFPFLKLDYHCRDLSPFCKYGPEVLPEVVFHDSDSSFGSTTFDLVFSSGSLQYVENWQTELGLLASVSAKYLYVTRIPMVTNAESFVVLQRPHGVQYPSEYLGWVFNQKTLLEEAQKLGLRLVREFIVQEQPMVPSAPEQPRYRGFLFRR